jgi:hypothetical protein
MQYIWKFKDGKWDKRTRGFWKDSLFEVYHAINKFHEEKNIQGNLGEIGIWYGRSLIPLVNFLNEGEKLIALDIFKEPHDTRESIWNMLKECYGDDVSDNVKIHKGTSKNTEVFSKENSFRLFYIDGDHTKNGCKNDLYIATKVLRDDGLIFLDDYLNPRYGKDIRQAVDEFCSETEFEKCFTTIRQLFLCKTDHVDEYINMMRESFLNEESGAQQLWFETLDSKYTYYFPAIKEKRLGQYDIPIFIPTFGDNEFLHRKAMQK